MAQGWTKNEERLLEAARKCDSATISEIVRSGKVNVNVADKSGGTALHLCCKSADLESLALLLEYGARTEVFDNTGMSPFHQAAVKDYIETMALLVSYGADVDVKNAKSLMTPLHYASRNRRIRAIKFLLFCGADPGLKDRDHHEAVDNMNKVEADRQKILRNAFRDKRIQICGKMIKLNEKHLFNTGLKLENMDKDSKTFSFLCRRTPVDYMDIDNPTGGKLEKVFSHGSYDVISDVYNYLVNQTVHNVTLAVPVYTKSNAFDTVLLRDNTGEDFKCTECVENSSGIYYTFVVALKANEDNINAFCVLSSLKVDEFITAGSAQTVRSSVDARFGVQLTDHCLPRNSTIKLQMLPVYDYLDAMNTEYVTGVTSFCELRLNHKNKKVLHVTLPLPEDTQYMEQHTDHAVYYASEGPHTQTDWKELRGGQRIDDKCIHVEDPSVASGTCVALKVRKERKKDFVDRVHEFLKWLYNSAFNRLKPCSFYGMSRTCSSDTYRVHIGVADSKRVDDIMQKWRKENFVSQLSQKTATHLMKSGSHFAVKPASDVSLKGMACQTLLYQCSRDFHQEFIICGKENDVITFLIHKISKQTFNENSYAANSGSFIAQLNVDLLEHSSEPTELKSSNVFTDYPDNKFLNWLSGELGNEWMMVGTCLGLKYSYLETLEKDNTLRRAIQTMLYSWREKVDNNHDIGLTVLIHSLTRVGRKDLITEINKEVQTLIKNKPGERLSLWVTGLASGLDDVDSGPGEESSINELCISCLIEEPAPLSPFSETFLHTVVSIIGPNFHLLAQLNLPQSTVDSITHVVHDPVSAMFKCLLIAKRKYSDVIGFFKDLLGALEVLRNREAIDSIKKECGNWFKSATSVLDKNDKRLEEVLDRY